MLRKSPRSSSAIDKSRMISASFLQGYRPEDTGDIHAHVQAAIDQDKVAFLRIIPIYFFLFLNNTYVVRGHNICFSGEMSNIIHYSNMTLTFSPLSV